jgi:hypothetical protein
MTYRLNRAHLLISVLAALVMTAGFVYRLFFDAPHTLFNMAWWVSFAIVLFYIIGQFARSILIEKVFLPLDMEYDLSQDEEYQTFMANLNDEAPQNTMQEEPLQMEMVQFDDLLDEPFAEPVMHEDAL